ncbi:MAG: glycogen phosphorylase, partial [Puniceicoccaceae bacterium]
MPTTTKKNPAKKAAAQAKSNQPPRKGFKFSVEPDAEGLKFSIVNHLRYTLARDPYTATLRDWWLCTSMAVRDRIIERMIKTQETHNRKDVRRTYYLSLEYLMGRMMTNNLINSGLLESTRTALKELGIDLDVLREEEVDMGLGNGGLGRLAACFLDSLATLDLPAVGYGIHYEYGLFRQEIAHGHQVEHPDNWTRYGTPWEIVRPEYTQRIKIYGRVEMDFDDLGDSCPHWVDTQELLGVPSDIPICGYGARTVNFLRLWSSRASEEFDLRVFNEGGYVEAVREKAVGETVSKVLYPNDKTENGKELRLVQQYFFVACSLHDIIRRYRKTHEGWDAFTDKVAIQLNDTHPALAVVELMRFLIDEEGLGWDHAWSITTGVMAYTNHTLLPE